MASHQSYKEMTLNKMTLFKDMLHLIFSRCPNSTVRSRFSHHQLDGLSTVEPMQEVFLKLLLRKCFLFSLQLAFSLNRSGIPFFKMALHSLRASPYSWLSSWTTHFNPPPTQLPTYIPRLPASDSVSWLTYHFTLWALDFFSSSKIWLYLSTPS